MDAARGGGNPAAPVVIRPAGGMIPADEWTARREEFIRRNYCGGAPDPEVDAFLTICKRRGLAPEEKQIYLIERGKKWTVQTSIDGQRVIAERSEAYAGSDEPVYEAGGRLTNNRPYPAKATVTVWKLVQGVRCPFTASAHWDEYNAGQNLWLTHPHAMLAKCAESAALRKAFPADLGGLYTAEETEDSPAATVQVLEAKGPGAPPAPPDRPVPEGKGGVVDAAMRSLHAMARDRNLTHEQVHALAVGAYGVASLTDCSRGQLTGLRQVLQECSPSEAAAVVQEVVWIDQLTGFHNLDAVEEQTHHPDSPAPPRVLDFLRYVIGRVRERNARQPVADPETGGIGDAPAGPQDAPGSTDAPPEGASPQDGDAPPPAPSDAVEPDAADFPDAERRMIEFREAVAELYTDANVGRRMTAVPAICAEAGVDVTRWKLLLETCPSRELLNAVRAEQLKVPAVKGEFELVAAYQARVKALGAAAMKE